jgi:hypothetical protein
MLEQTARSLTASCVLCHILDDGTQTRIVFIALLKLADRNFHGLCLGDPFLNAP